MGCVIRDKFTALKFISQSLWDSNIKSNTVQFLLLEIVPHKLMTTGNSHVRRFDGLDLALVEESLHVDEYPQAVLQVLLTDHTRAGVCQTQ